MRCSVSWALSSKETHPCFRHCLREPTPGKSISRCGRVSQSPFPTSCLVRKCRGLALGFESVPHSSRKKRLHKPQISASVQPLLANTSLSNHPIFTSSVYTLADGLQVSESPAVAVDGCHRVLGAHRKRGRLFTVPNTGEGTTSGLPPSAARQNPGFRVFSLSLVPSSTTAAPFKPSVSPAQHPACSAERFACQAP